MSFTTTGSVPTVTTQAATNLSASGAKLNGIVNANNLTTTVTFEYGLTSGYGQTASAIPAQITGNVNVGVYATLTGLTQGTTYHFRIKGQLSGYLWRRLTYYNKLITGYGYRWECLYCYNRTSLAQGKSQTTKYTDGTAIPNITDNTGEHN
jgi:hypothetical protein